MQTYDSYKNSGIDWLGEIPSYWELNKLKFLFTEKSKTLNPNLPAGSISFGEVVFKDDEKIPESTKATYQEVLSGDYLINPLNLNYDLISLRIALSKIDVVVSSGYIVLQDITDINKEFYKWLLHQYDVAYMKLLGSGVRQTISFNHIANSLLPTPPISEQEAIAAFLDEKCEKIDELVSVKEQQIALLKERRQVVIHEAVTKGIQPNVAMKDSGIDWIGEIPSHWEVKRFANSFTLGKGLTITKEYLRDKGIFCLNYGEIHSKYGFEVNPEIHPLRCVDVDYLNTSSQSLLDRGDFVFADTSEDIKGSGNFTYLNSNIRTFAGYHTVIAKPNKDLNSRFLAYEFDSSSFRSQIQSKVKGVKVFSITQTLLKTLFIWLPPIQEQEAIVAYLDEQTGKIDQAIAIKTEQIEKLKAYKQSLINEVVTGKVKVS